MSFGLDVDSLCTASTNRTAHVKLDPHARYIHMRCRNGPCRIQPYMSNAAGAASKAMLGVSQALLVLNTTPSNPHVNVLGFSAVLAP